MSSNNLPLHRGRLPKTLRPRCFLFSYSTSLMNRNYLKHSFLACSVALAAALLSTSCGAIYEDSDCVESATVFTFTYDMNLKHADAFDHEVKSVHVLMFDTEGVLRYKWRKAKSDLIDGNKLAVDVIPGDYDVLTWAGDYHESATVSDGIIGKSRLEDYHCRVHRDADGNIRDHIEHFFHNLSRVSLPYASPRDPHRETINLTKDTNSVRIVLQQLSGQPVDMSDLHISISDANGWLNHDNSLRADQILTYHPWHVQSGSVEVTSSRASLGAMTGELTLSRLVTHSKPMVTVARTDGTKVFSIPLIDYALLVKGQYDKNMSDQEYLDRQDEYNMTFFLDERLQWVSSQIIINDWVIVNHDIDLIYPI